MPKFLNSLDVYILASKSEGFPLKLLEAASCGRICISTKVGGAEDLIKDKENGYFFERNKNNLVEILNKINQNRLNETKKGLLLRREIQKSWVWEKTSKQWLDFFKKNLV